MRSQDCNIVKREPRDPSVKEEPTDHTPATSKRRLSKKTSTAANIGTHNTVKAEPEDSCDNGKRGLPEVATTAQHGVGGLGLVKAEQDVKRPRTDVKQAKDESTPGAKLEAKEESAPGVKREAKPIHKGPTHRDPICLGTYIKHIYIGISIDRALYIHVYIYIYAIANTD